MSARPLNEAFSKGGLPCVVRTIENLTGLQIPYAGLVTFNAVVKITDAIGGVPVCLTAPLHDEYISYPGPDGSMVHLDLPAGITPISGGEALGFLRSRHGVGDGSDLGRISSQQQYLSSLIRKVKSNETLTDPVKLYSIANIIADPGNVTLSSTLTNPATMISMAQAFRADQPFTLGADSQGIGTTAEPIDPGASPAAPGTEAAPPSPSASASASASASPSPTLDGVAGQTAEQPTCAIPNNG